MVGAISKNTREGVDEASISEVPTRQCKSLGARDIDESNIVKIDETSIYADSSTIVIG